MIFEDDHLVNYNFTNDGGSLYDGYVLLNSDGRILCNSFGIQRSIVEAATYLVSLKDKSIVDVYSNDLSDKKFVDFFNNYLTELNKKLHERKLFNLYNDIDLFTKKYCISNDYDITYGDEWIEVSIDSDYIIKLEVERVLLFSKNTADYYNIKYNDLYYKSDDEEILDIPTDLFPVFYTGLYNSNESIKTSYDSDSSKFYSLIFGMSLYQLEGNPYYLKNTFYSVIFFKLEVVNQILLKHFCRYNFFDEFDSNLTFDKELVFRIFKKDYFKK